MNLYNSHTHIYIHKFNIQINSGSGDEIKRLIRSDLAPLLATKFSHFTRDLVDRKFCLYSKIHCINKHCMIL